MKKLLIASAMCLALFSCKKDNLDEIPSTTVNGKMKTGVSRSIGDSTLVPTNMTVPLLAGQTSVAGSVNIVNDGTTLFVTYTTINGYTLDQLHLYVGEFVNAPQTNSGNPVPGHFPFNISFSTPVTTYTFQLPLANYPDCFIVAAHSVVRQNGTETAWGSGTQFPGNNWGMYINYCKLSTP